MASGLLQKWFDKRGKSVPTLDLLRLCTLNDGLESKTSTIIGISGFTSKNTNKDLEWSKLYEYYMDHQYHSNIYALNWEAKNVKEIAKGGGKTIVQHIALKSFMKGVGKATKVGGKGGMTVAGKVFTGIVAA